MDPKKPNYNEEYARQIEYTERYSKNNVDTKNGMNREEEKTDDKKK